MRNQLWWQAMTKHGLRSFQERPDPHANPTQHYEKEAIGSIQLTLAYNDGSSLRHWPNRDWHTGSDNLLVSPCA